MNLRRLIQPDPDWLDAPTPQRVAAVALTACAGLAVYGFTVGFWRDPVMGAYVAMTKLEQLWAAPAKVTAGLIFSGLICFPSL